MKTTFLGVFMIIAGFIISPIVWSAAEKTLDWFFISACFAGFGLAIIVTKIKKLRKKSR